jgi:hypothetical protein
MRGMEGFRDQGFQTAQGRQITTGCLAHKMREKERRNQLGDDQIALRESTARLSRVAVRATPRLATERVRAMLRSRSSHRTRDLSSQRSRTSHSPLRSVGGGGGGTGGSGGGGGGAGGDGDGDFCFARPPPRMHQHASSSPSKTHGAQPHPPPPHTHSHPSAPLQPQTSRATTHERKELVHQLRSHLVVGGIGSRAYTFSPPFSARGRARAGRPRGGGGGGALVGGRDVESLLSGVDSSLVTSYLYLDTSQQYRNSHLNTFPQKSRGKGFSCGVNSMGKGSSLVVNSMRKRFSLVVDSISAKAPR